MHMEDNPVFMLKARRCKRCGRLLTSKESVKVGYSHSCLMKLRKEEHIRQPIDGQLNLFESEEYNNGKYQSDDEH